MRILQFWILMLLSCFACFFNVRLAFLNREVNQQQRLVDESQADITEGDAYENAWKQLSMSIYQNGKDDPSFLNILKKEGVDVRATVTPNTAPTTPGATPAMPSVPPKTATTPPHASTTGTP